MEATPVQVEVTAKEDTEVLKLGLTTVTVYVVDWPQEVYVITEVPAETPLTNPLVFTVATPVVADDHVPPLTECDNWIVEPTPTVLVPVILEK